MQVLHNFICYETYQYRNKYVNLLLIQFKTNTYKSQKLNLIRIKLILLYDAIITSLKALIN